MTNDSIERMPARPIRRLIALSCLLIAPSVWAHGTSIGDINIDHPYAVVTPPGATTGAVYFRAIKNTGKLPDRLVSARTTVAASVELHTMRMDGNVMRMREVAGIELPAQTETLFRHDSAQGYHLMLIGLKAPLKDGDRFKLSLKFERAGEKDVTIDVQRTKNPSLHQH